MSKMELQASTITNLKDARESVTYHPSVWGDYFLSCASNLREISPNEEQVHQKLKEDVRELLNKTPNNSLLKLELIDAIQQLGVGYQFEEEIDESLKKICENNPQGIIEDNTDLHTTALCFRLLRQQGYHISPDVFGKFIHDESWSSDDARGVLSLYEACQYSTHGEEILDEALEFSASHLKSIMVSQVVGNGSLAAQIKEALDTPIHKSLTRLHAAKFIPMYQEDESHNETLLTFAKMDFNFLQMIHKREISEITRWWKALDLPNKLPFARDRMVECYLWVVGMYFEPQFRDGRFVLSKVLALGSVMDDIYDVRGTMDELTLFTDAIQRWDVSAMEKLPPYMRIYYEALLNMFKEIEDLEKPDGTTFRETYAREEMKGMDRAYFEEAKWLFEEKVPTLEEYMEVALPSAGYVLVNVIALVGMGGYVGEQDFRWASKDPSIVHASSIIARLMDDMAGCGFEKKLSAVDCYMGDKSATKEEALDQLRKQVWNAWKDINQECLHETAVSKLVLKCVANSARVIHFIYKDGDGYTDSKTWMKDAINYVLVQPQPIIT